MVASEGDFFRNTATEQTGDLGAYTLRTHAVAIFFRQEDGHAKGAPTGNNRHFVYRVVVRHEPPDDGMARFVIGRIELLFFLHHHGLALGAHHDFIFRFVELFHAYQALAASSGKERRLVD